MNPIGLVKNNRNEITDDFWGNVVSDIILDNSIPEESLKELSSFSHIYVIFYFHKVNDEKIVVEARHPRNNSTLPKVGIFAQRAKNRINKIGLTVCELIKVEGRVLTVKNLDAINSTPVLDIKPFMKEFEPAGLVKQPIWTSEIMKNYFK